MIQWTPEAEDALRRYLDGTRAEIESDGGDAEEVAADVRRHVDEELIRRGAVLGEASEVGQILGQMGRPERLAVDGEPEPAQRQDARPGGPPIFPFAGSPRAPRAAAPSINRKLGVWFLIYAVVFPLIVIAIELVWRMCADTFFDPMPTWWHAAMVMFVPFSNFVAWRQSRGKLSLSSHKMALMLGISSGIAFLYTLAFAPLMIAGVIAIIFFGIGFLTFAPLLAFIGSLRGAIARGIVPGATSSIARMPLFWLSFALGVFLPAVANIPDFVSDYGIRWAASADPAEARGGIEFLRRWGNRELLHRACYVHTNNVGSFWDMFDDSDTVPFEKTREIYYRVTGENSSSRPIPWLRQRRGPTGRNFNFDFNQGSEITGDLIPGLALTGSRIDGMADAAADAAYLEWTMEFLNSGSRQQEARMQVALPAGGAVSRLTLWVNGEPREAVFAGRSQSRGAYQQVVSRRRDPVLVTTSGPDRVMVQCFPVPPNGGTMKIRFGITAPLDLLSSETARLQLPAIFEQNFVAGAPGETPHSIWIESHDELGASNAKLQPEHPDGKLFAIRGSLDSASLLAPAAAFTIRRSSPARIEVAADLKEPGRFIRQQIAQRLTSATEHQVVVLDTSSPMTPWLHQIAEGMRALPPGCGLQVIVAGEEPALLETGGRGESVDLEKLVKAIEAIRPLGGIDNLPALQRAWDLAAAHPHGKILWIHAAQPLLLSSVEPLIQKWERRPAGPDLYDLPVEPGIDKPLEELAGIAKVHAAARRGTLGDDLAALQESWAGRKPEWFVERQAVAMLDAGTTPTLREPLAGHVARLWALDQIAKLSLQGQSAQPRAPLRLATRYRLVTPISGAVVLENDQQYKQAGLDATDLEIGDIPTIPEPETWALLIVAALALIFVCWKQRSRPWKPA